jgi:hypothetical protein
MRRLVSVVIVFATLGLPACTGLPATSPTATAPIATPTEVPSPPQSPSQPATPDPSPPGPTPPTSDEWTPPVQLSRQGRFHSLALAVDNAGRAHAAAGIEEHGIWYLADSDGDWLAELVAEAPAGGADRDPAIAVADDGTIHVLFVRWDAWHPCTFECPPDPSLLGGLFHAIRTAEGWSEPARMPLEVTGEDWVGELDLAHGGDGLHLVVRRTAGESDEVWYGHQSDAMWEIEQVTDDGWAPSIGLAADGTPVIAYTRGHEAGYGIEIASRQGNGFAGSFVDGTAGLFLTHLGLDGEGAAHLVLWSEDGSNLHMAQDDGEWGTPATIGRNVGAAVLDGRGALHLLYDEHGADGLDGLWYLSNRAGDFERLRLSTDTRMVEDGPGPPAAIAVDRAGRPHALFASYYSELHEGLWYAIGPSSPSDE